MNKKTVRDIDLNAAREFNIPIVLINTEKIAHQESEKLNNLYKDILNSHCWEENRS